MSASPFMRKEVLDIFISWDSENQRIIYTNEVKKIKDFTDVSSLTTQWNSDCSMVLSSEALK